MGTWVQLSLFTPPRAIPHSLIQEHEPISPPQLWSLLTPTQQHNALQSLIQIGLEITQAATAEAHDDPA